MTLLWKFSATELARDFRTGDITPTEIALACLARLDAVNPSLNAIIARRDDAFLAEAQAASERFERGTPLSMLDGIPLSIKDNIPMAGLPTTWGSLALRDYVPTLDEWVVTRARTAGALIIGKTNVPEFTLDGYTGNLLFGTTRNPWDPALTPGGSSGGAVTAVSAGITPLAIGTDGGGSIRRPASHTGLVGLKPSLGAIARGNMLPPLLMDFEVVGPMGRTVADVRMLFDILRGPVEADRASLAAAQAIAGRSKKPTRNRRILFVERLGAAPLDPQIAASVRAAVEVFAGLGHAVEVGDLPLDLDFINAAWPQVGAIGLDNLFAKYPAWGQGVAPKYLEMAAQARQLPASRVLAIIDEVDALRRQATELFNNFDVVLTPSAAALPWQADQPTPTEIDGQAVGPRGHAIYTSWVNVTGLPAVSVPCAPSAQGLPIGLQLIGGYGADLEILELADAFETAQPWAGRWPAM